MREQDRAEQAAAAMMADDRASAWFGMVLDEIRPGYARMSLTIGGDHLNGHGICHGGVIFALADSAFAFACNSRNRKTVAWQNQITYLSPGQPGEKLTAEAREITLSGRSGVTDVTVTGGDGRVVALFRGASRQIAGTHFEEES